MATPSLVRRPLRFSVRRGVGDRPIRRPSAGLTSLQRLASLQRLLSLQCSTLTTTAVACWHQRSSTLPPRADRCGSSEQTASIPRGSRCGPRGWSGCRCGRRPGGWARSVCQRWRSGVTVTSRRSGWSASGWLLACRARAGSCSAAWTTSCRCAHQSRSPARCSPSSMRQRQLPPGGDAGVSGRAGPIPPSQVVEGGAASLSAVLDWSWAAAWKQLI
jgi:hypothetical protein